MQPMGIARYAKPELRGRDALVVFFSYQKTAPIGSGLLHCHGQQFYAKPELLNVDSAPHYLSTEIVGRSSKKNLGFVEKQAGWVDATPSSLS